MISSWDGMWVLVVGNGGLLQDQAQLRTPWNNQSESKLCVLKANETLGAGCGGSEVSEKRSPLPTSVGLSDLPADVTRAPLPSSGHTAAKRRNLSLPLLPVLGDEDLPAARFSRAGQDWGARGISALGSPFSLGQSLPDGNPKPYSEVYPAPSWAPRDQGSITAPSNVLCVLDKSENLSEPPGYNRRLTLSVPPASGVVVRACETPLA